MQLTVHKQKNQLFCQLPKNPFSGEVTRFSGICYTFACHMNCWYLPQAFKISFKSTLQELQSPVMVQKHVISLAIKLLCRINKLLRARFKKYQYMYKTGHKPIQKNPINLLSDHSVFYCAVHSLWSKESKGSTHSFWFDFFFYWVVTMFSFIYSNS